MRNGLVGERLLKILTQANEDTEGFRSTSRYIVVMGRSTRQRPYDGHTPDTRGVAHAALKVERD